MIAQSEDGLKVVTDPTARAALQEHLQFAQTMQARELAAPTLAAKLPTPNFVSPMPPPSVHPVGDTGTIVTQFQKRPSTQYFGVANVWTRNFSDGSVLDVWVGQLALLPGTGWIEVTRMSAEPAITTVVAEFRTGENDGTGLHIVSAQGDLLTLHTAAGATFTLDAGHPESTPSGLLPVTRDFVVPVPH